MRQTSSRNSKRSRRSDRNAFLAFTLVELLVVIAILAILFILAVPMATKGIEGARKTKCVSNLRQIGQATLSYAADNDQLLPPFSVQQTNGSYSLFWYEAIRPYLGQTSLTFPVGKNDAAFYCPSVNHAKAYPQTDYGANTFVFQLQPFPSSGLTVQTKTTRIAFPSQLVMYSEVLGNSAGANPESSWQLVAQTVISSPTTWFPTNRHGKKVNAVFCDGHVQSIPRSEVVTNFTTYFGATNLW